MLYRDESFLYKKPFPEVLRRSERQEFQKGSLMFTKASLNIIILKWFYAVALSIT